MSSPVAHASPNLEQYLEAIVEKYDACVTALPETYQAADITASLRFHHLRFDGNGQPKFAELAAALADHMIYYCFSSRRRRDAARADEFIRLDREARNYLRKVNTSGEAGELLLYLLLEVVLRAPQIVAKIELKTNRRMEGFGSDGIHVKWHDEDELLDVFFGEAKLETTAAGAISSLVESLEKFHANDQTAFELSMVTGHYKHADSPTKEEVLGLLDGSKPTGRCRINHACLLGFDYAHYGRLGPVSFKDIEREFQKLYSDDLPRLKKLLNDHFASFPHRQLRFEVFFLQFRTVHEFREAFLKAVS